METLLLGIVSALCVGLIIAMFDAYKDLKRLQGEVEPLKRDNAQLNAKLEKERESGEEALKGFRNYHDHHIEGQEKKIEELSLSHDEWKGVALHCMKALDRIKPGWVEKHLINGEPEYEIVMMPPIKRPAPPPRASDKKKVAAEQPPQVTEEW